MRKQLYFLVIGLIFISALQSQNYNQVWNIEVEGYVAGYANVDSDSNIELLVLHKPYSNSNDRLLVVDGVTGEVEYSTTAGWYYAINSVQPIDVNNDGRSEILMDYKPTSNTDKIAIIAYGSLGINDKGVEESGFYSTNYPNPFFNATTIEYNVENGVANVSINIYDQSGNLIFNQEEGKKEMGNHQYIWKGVDSNGSSVSSGIYYYGIQIDGVQGTKTMIKL